jgi:glycosyltransferase involved in cell wall biosynthesis
MTSPLYNYSLSVIIPVFNDEEALPELFRRLILELDKLTSQYEIIFVDDGSTDSSLEVLKRFSAESDAVKVMQLTRNFGQPNAITAGLEEAYNEVIVLMDSDLQDRPEDIGKLLDAMEEADVPMAVAGCSKREDSSIKIAASKVFNSFSNRVTSVQFASGVRVFRAMRREIVNEVLKFQEVTATPLSLLGWMGYDHIVVDLERDRRYAGSSGYTFRRMLKLSLDRIFSYSLFPIRLAGILGVILGCASILLAIYFVIQKLFLKNILPGWTSIVVIVLFLSGMNFIFIGILGEYLGRIYMEVKKRPRYVVKKIFKKSGGEDR